MSRTLIVIPARYASTRLPGKPLLAETGKPLIVHTAEAAARVPNATVVVATDDQRIYDAVETAGFRGVMTSADHQSGTDRIAEAAALVAKQDGATPEVVVNLQGDEPEVSPGTISALISTHIAAQEGPTPAFASTVCCPFPGDASPEDPNAVKAVLTPPDKNGVRWALYFSRARIPYPRHDEDVPHQAMLHLGLYAFSPDSLSAFPAMAQTPAEKTESLEQLRILEHGHRIAVSETDHAAPGIDTPADYAAFVARVGSGLANS